MMVYMHKKAGAAGCEMKMTGSIHERDVRPEPVCGQDGERAVRGREEEIKKQFFFSERF
jgi:hypothetical protein